MKIQRPETVKKYKRQNKLTIVVIKLTCFLCKINSDPNRGLYMTRKLVQTIGNGFKRNLVSQWRSTTSDRTEMVKIWQPMCLCSQNCKQRDCEVVNLSSLFKTMQVVKIIYLKEVIIFLGYQDCMALCISWLCVCVYLYTNIYTQFLLFIILSFKYRRKLKH